MMSTEDLFLINRWGEGYFEINSSGHVAVKPDRKEISGDIFNLVTSLVEKGIEPPILIRFNGIIRDRIHVLSEAFQSAIKEFHYRNTHRMVFPIKVNPQRHVVEIVQQAGKSYGMGLEVGSKPELIAVLALEDNPETLLLCNGYKDAEYIFLALMASKLGRRTLIIIEQAYELKLVLDAAEQIGIDAEIGFRMKMSTKGTGRWMSSGGEHSKFGLFSHEIVACIDKLEEVGKSNWVKLLHFHLGSQITNIDSIKMAIKEGARMYTELAALLPSLSHFDVGGGLAVDYDGTKSTSNSSMNYTIDEYARDVVSEIGEACAAAGIMDPVIVTESGRSIVSHHSVLIIEVIDVNSIESESERLNFDSKNPIIQDLVKMDEHLSVSNCRETFHDILELKEHTLEEFIYGKMSLKERAFAEKKIQILLTNIRLLYIKNHLNENELAIINKILLETYFCNFSVFQSLPDSWAIDQLFPVMPIQRLHEQLTHETILADLSCDSDGKINKFIGSEEVEEFIKLHKYTGEPYYLGIFLVGAYQEILGGLHNLFGDTNVVHAELGANGEWEFSRLVEGDTIEEVLQYVQYNTERLMEQLHELLERSVKSGRITSAESASAKKKFKEALESYTYLVV